MSLTPALGKQRQEGLDEFEASLFQREREKKALASATAMFSKANASSLSLASMCLPQILSCSTPMMSHDGSSITGSG